MSPAVSEPGDVVRFPPTPYVPRRRRARPHSIDVAAFGTPSQPTSLATVRPGTSSSAQTPRLPGVKGSAPPNVPPRRPTAPSALTTSPDQPLPVVRTPVSSLTGNTRRSSTPPSAGGAFSATTSPGGGGWRGHPRWRLISFLSRDAEAARDGTGPAVDGASAAVATDADADSPTRMTVPSTSLPDGEPDGAPAESPRPRKGDVVCLSYRTLDDRGMRRLEGRSDHRPVIGVYAIYV
jgi:hypothetical protein